MPMFQTPWLRLPAGDATSSCKGPPAGGQGERPQPCQAALQTPWLQEAAGRSSLPASQSPPQAPGGQSPLPCASRPCFALGTHAHTQRECGRQPDTAGAVCSAPWLTCTPQLSCPHPVGERGGLLQPRGAGRVGGHERLYPPLARRSLPWLVDAVCSQTQAQGSPGRHRPRQQSQKAFYSRLFWPAHPDRLLLQKLSHPAGSLLQPQVPLSQDALSAPGWGRGRAPRPTRRSAMPPWHGPVPVDPSLPGLAPLPGRRRGCSSQPTSRPPCSCSCPGQAASRVQWGSQALVLALTRGCPPAPSCAQRRSREASPAGGIRSPAARLPVPLKDLKPKSS